MPNARDKLIASGAIKPTDKRPITNVANRAAVEARRRDAVTHTSKALAILENARWNRA